MLHPEPEIETDDQPQQAEPERQTVDPAPQPEPRRSKRRRHKPKYRRGRDPPVADAAYTIKGFCRAHHISEAFYFKLKKLGLAPKEMKVERRVLISIGSADRWRRERERAAAEMSAT